MRFEPGSRDTVYSSLIALLALEKENRIRGGESTGFTPRLYTCTFTRIQTHTHTSSSTRYSHPQSRSACTQNHWVHSLTSILYARSPPRHRRKSFQKFTPTNAILPFRMYFRRENTDCGNHRGNRETPEKCVGRCLPRRLSSHRFIASHCFTVWHNFMEFSIPSGATRAFRHAVNLYYRSKTRDDRHRESLSPERHPALYRVIGRIAVSRSLCENCTTIASVEKSLRVALFQVNTVHSKICVTFSTYIYQSTRSRGRGPRVKSEWWTGIREFLKSISPSSLTLNCRCSTVLSHSETSIFRLLVM